MEYTVINYLFDKGETVSEGVCFTSQSKVTGLNDFCKQLNCAKLCNIKCFFVMLSNFLSRMIVRKVSVCYTELTTSKKPTGSFCSF